MLNIQYFERFELNCHYEINKRKQLYVKPAESRYDLIPIFYIHQQLFQTNSLKQGFFLCQRNN